MKAVNNPNLNQTSLKLERIKLWMKAAALMKPYRMSTDYKEPPHWKMCAKGCIAEAKWNTDARRVAPSTTPDKYLIELLCEYVELRETYWGFLGRGEQLKYIEEKFVKVYVIYDEDVCVEAVPRENVCDYLAEIAVLLGNMWRRACGE